jgi:hypothetical protein
VVGGADFRFQIFYFLFEIADLRGQISEVRVIGVAGIYQIGESAITNEKMSALWQNPIPSGRRLTLGIGSGE